MKYVKHAVCISCGHELEAAPDITVCPKCGGMLDIVYDYDAIKKVLNRDTFAARSEKTHWRYGELLPVEDTTSMTTQEVEGETFFIGKLPYPWTPFSKFYESRMYQELYHFPAVERVEEFTSFYTRYFPSIAVDAALCKYYRYHKREYKHNYLYRSDVLTFDPDKGAFVPVSSAAGGGASGEGVDPLPETAPAAEGEEKEA